MKKVVSRAVAVILCVVLVMSLVACGGGGSTTKVEGTTWALTGMEQNGQKFTMDEIKATMGEITYEFKADGVCEAGVMGMAAEAKYTQDGDKVTVDDGQQKVTMTVKGNTMTGENAGVTMTFTKK